MQALPQRTELLFIQDGVGHRRRSKQARSHVAKVIRQKQKDEKLKKLGRNVVETSTLTASPSRENPASKSPRATVPTSKDDSALPAPGTVGASRGAGKLLASSRRSRSAPTVLQLTRSPTLIFGGLSARTHITEQYPDSKEVADFCFKHIIPSWLAPEHRSAWFAAFLNDPLTFHCLNYSCGVLQDVTSRRPIRHERFMHRYRTIQLVNEQLGNLDTVDLEPIMLAVMTLWRINTEQLAEQRPVPLLFVPHKRSASWVVLFGTLGSEDVHSQALVQLVRRAGGLGNFRTLPGLQESLAMADISDSSSKAKKPSFASVWIPDVYLGMLEPALRPLWEDPEGQGFEISVPGGLPSSTRTVLYRLSNLDKLLDEFSSRVVTSNEECLIGALGYGVQHDVLSMPPWHSLNQEQREGSYLVTYELCRITAIIYSNATILYMSPGEIWLDKLLNESKNLIVISDISTWDAEMRPLLLWSLIIGGVASFWTGHRSFYMTTLRRALQLWQITNWPEVKTVVEQFLWRDSSCAEGAATLWNCVQLDDMSDYAPRIEEEEEDDTSIQFHYQTDDGYMPQREQKK